MELPPFGQQLFLILLMGRVRHTDLHGTYLGAAGLFIVSHTFGTAIRVDDIDRVALSDSGIRAFRLTGPTADAILFYFIGHYTNLLLG
jgi:hypothetical protein